MTEDVNGEITSTAYAYFLDELRLNDQQKELVKALIRHLYIDGWTDGNAHGNVWQSQDSFDGMIDKDLESSWASLIIEEME
jgi:hypothetical protein